MPTKEAKTTETEQSPRGIAERLVVIVEHQSGVDLASGSRPNMLIDAVEKALRDRDDRGAKIAHSKLIEEDIEEPISKRIADGAHNAACLAIYEAIRGKS